MAEAAAAGPEAGAPTAPAAESDAAADAAEAHGSADEAHGLDATQAVGSADGARGLDATQAHGSADEALSPDATQALAEETRPVVPTLALPEAETGASPCRALVAVVRWQTRRSGVSGWVEHPGAGAGGLFLVSAGGRQHIGGHLTLRHFVFRASIPCER